LPQKIGVAWRRNEPGKTRRFQSSLRDEFVVVPRTRP